MDQKAHFYFGHAANDQIGNTGWFLGQFVPEQAGLRHQTDVELKWGLHKHGERRSAPWATEASTTVAILIAGALQLEFHIGETPQMVMLEKQGDYVVYGPDIVHSWEAVGDAVVLTVRFPSVEVRRPVKARQGVES